MKGTGEILSRLETSRAIGGDHEDRGYVVNHSRDGTGKDANPKNGSGNRTLRVHKDTSQISRYPGVDEEVREDHHSYEDPYHVEVDAS